MVVADIKRSFVDFLDQLLLLPLKYYGYILNSPDLLTFSPIPKILSRIRVCRIDTSRSKYELWRFGCKAFITSKDFRDRLYKGLSLPIYNTMYVGLCHQVYSE